MNNYIQKFRCFLIIAVSLICQAPFTLHAQEDPNDPVVITRQTVNDVITDMQANKAVYEADRSKLVAMVEERLLPRFNFNVMTQLAVGRPWSQTSPEQKSSLQNEFRTLLVRTYTNVLFAKRHETTTVLSSNTTRQGDVTIEMEVSNQTGEPVKLALRMRADNGDWKVIDVTVGGVSLIVNYRTSFTTEISKSGVDGLIQSLKDKNQANTE